MESVSHNKWKIVRFSRSRGNKFSRSMSYGAALDRFLEERKHLTKGEHVYMIQVIDHAVGTVKAMDLTADMVDDGEIEIGRPAFLTEDV